MSTFGGIIREILGISVDRFDGDNISSEAFFLSHCHTDHMVGLNSTYFQEKLKRENHYLYVSPISMAILKDMYPNICCQLKELSLQSPTSFGVNNIGVSVTCIPAGHCPGSVMFLFQTCDICILYTGDYRVSSSDIKKFKCFYDTFGKVKTIHKIYLDTTFFLDSYSKFPKREDSLKELCKIILDWLEESPTNCIKLDTRAKYGYEYLFKEISERCKMPVHISKDILQFYSLVPELDHAVTEDGSKTKIHCCRYGYTAICDFASNHNMRIIRTSAFRWKDHDFNSNGLSSIEDASFFVCYSTHASYEEGLALLDFLKPKAVEACVEQRDVITNKVMHRLIKKKLEEFQENDETLHIPSLFKLRGGGEESPPKKVARTWKSNSILDSPTR